MVETSPILTLPFLLLLGAMAVGPTLAPGWWTRYYGLVALVLGATTIGLYGFGLHDFAVIGQAAGEYFSFIALIGSLFVVAGGIRIEVGRAGTPGANAVFLLAGAVAANFLGTTGAAMLLIRPWLRMNRRRPAAHHAAFFIFLIANAGGGLTPIGDPPLFLGYLEGVPFWWVLQHGWAAWATAVGLLLVLFYGVDWWHFRRSRGLLQPELATQTGWSLAGWPNLFFLAVILGAAFVRTPAFLGAGLMLAAGVASYCITPKSIHKANGFDFHPLNEVAVLFAGIFATLPPALAWLNGQAAGLAGPQPSPGFFYWSAGGLSGFLDNAPTYLGFLSGLRGAAGSPTMPELLAHHPGALLAISFGSVLFGAVTYIGNGPNLMVKSVATQAGVPMPSFAGFLLKFSLPLLLPVLIVVWWLFFRS